MNGERLRKSVQGDEPNFLLHAYKDVQTGLFLVPAHALTLSKKPT